MARKLSSDKLLFIALVALSLFGCVMIYSASAVSAAQTGGSPYRYLVQQIVALAAGGPAPFSLYRADYRLFARRGLGLPVYGACLVLCVAALTRPPITSARRWLTIGPVMLQPSELLKIGLVLVLARLVTAKAAEPERALPAALLFTGLAAGVVVLEPDLGTAASYVVLCAVLLWLS